MGSLQIQAWNWVRSPISPNASQMWSSAGHFCVLILDDLWIPNNLRMMKLKYCNFWTRSSKLCVDQSGDKYRRYIRLNMCTYLVRTFVTLADSSGPESLFTSAPREGNIVSKETKSAHSNVPLRPVLVNRCQTQFDCPHFLKPIRRPLPNSLFSQSMKTWWALLQPDLVWVAYVSLLSSASNF